MISRLYIDNMFKHFNKTFTFEEGLTGVVGPNESGKSLITEAIRFALFGSDALRGRAEDYKKLHVELDFYVNGQNYTVIRKPNKVELVGIASGTKPVNAAIQRLLGYDLKVFDVANACNQGNVEALSSMRPTERKAMVDKTVGLTVLDDLIAFCGTEANALKREAAALESGLVRPVAPVAPQNFRPSDEVLDEVKALEADERELIRLTELVRHAPEYPKFTPDPDAEAKLEAASQAARELVRVQARIAAAPAVPAAPEPCSVTATVAELTEHQEHRQLMLRSLQNLDGLIAALEPEVYDGETLKELSAQWDAYELWLDRQRLLAQGMLCCPECNHEWPVAGNVPDAVETAKPNLSRAQIRAYETRVGNNERIAELQRQKAEIVLPEDRSAELKLAQRHEAQMGAYQQQLEAYESFNAELPKLKETAAELSKLADEVPTLKEHVEALRAIAWFEKHESEFQRFNELSKEPVQSNLAARRKEYSDAVQYETLLGQYTELSRQYDDSMAQLEETKGKQQAYAEARDRISALKVSVKTHLLPSLNKVASALLSQMTGGERYLVQIDEDFEIAIDGQPIGTLSGSGKAVANLAIRIALGQILTNRVFSLFMADEVDAAMDNERADYTAQALRRLTDHVKQVVLVTHKRPATDNLIELKK